MLAVKDQILHARVHCQLRPLLGVEFPRIELLGKLFILLHGDLRSAHDPFANPADFFPFPFTRRQRVKTPVDEQAVFSLIEPLQASFLGFGWGRGFGLCPGKARSQQD